MKRKLALILILCLSLGIFAVGCSSSEPGVQAPAGEDTSWEDIQAKGYFVVGLDDAFPPMGFREEGTNDIIGFDIDLAKEAAKRLGVDVQFQPVVWDTVIEELNGGKIDVIWNGLTITEERKEKIAFTDPYVEDKQIIVVQKSSDIATKADLADKVVGIQAGSSAMKAVQKDAATYESIGEFVEFGSNDEALLDLATGRLDAVVVDEVVGRYYIAKKPDDYKVLEEHFGLEEFGVGLRKNDTSFLAELQKVLDEMKADGTMTEVSNKWFGEDITK
ncbi:MAG: amino acid ABC transporter substrate-binding protein [Syntrophomonadaceae bacterium]|nr:amino acid ABC transporter substrate-binding protein [Syntrophomonadaceae bacterium]